MKILAAIVTHNRVNLLSRCVEHILAQTWRPDEVVVINNGSTDGTVEMLAMRGVRCITQENLGSAGGWKRAIELAIHENFDWVWLMDDDGYPDNGALEKLIGRLSQSVACVSSVVVREHQPDTFVFPIPKLNRHGLPALLRWPRKYKTTLELRERCNGGAYAFAHLFNGALLSVDVAKRIGDVDERYFLFGDEVDYFFRLRRFGEVVSDLDALHYHPDVSGRPLSEVKAYYYLKNTLILHRLYFNQVAIRNIGAVIILLIRIWRRNGLQEAINYIFGSRQRIIREAINRGWWGSPSKDFPL